jgi:hypothetical protein
MSSDCPLIIYELSQIIYELSLIRYELSHMIKAANTSVRSDWPLVRASDGHR